MSKKLFILSISAILQIYLFNSKVYADTPLPSCHSKSVITDLNPLKGSDRKAKFTIDVGDTTIYKSWKMEFQCGIPKNKVDAKKENGSQISYDLDRRGLGDIQPCEFNTGLDTINAVGINNGNQEIPHCVASYNVVDEFLNQESQCSLDITPKENITVDSTLTITGSNFVNFSGNILYRNISYILYIDNVQVHKFNTSSFSITIDPKFMTPNQRHDITVSRDMPVASQFDPFGIQLVRLNCSDSYKVGPDKDHPGKEIKGTAPLTDYCRDHPDKCSSAGGDPCKTEENRGPGFITAIGCVHTNPAEFVKDFMKWVLGIGGGLSFLMMLMGAFQMLTSAGNPETLNAGKDRLTSAIIGLLMVIFAILLLQIIGVGILKIPGFK